MAQDSKRKKRERRERRQRTIQRLFPILQRNVELERQNRGIRELAQHTQQQHGMAVITLLTVLVQKGGEVEVTKGTLQNVQDDLSKLTFSVDQSEMDTNVLVVRVKTVEQAKDGADAGDAHQDLTITKIEDDEDPGPEPSEGRTQAVIEAIQVGL